MKTDRNAYLEGVKTGAFWGIEQRSCWSQESERVHLGDGETEFLISGVTSVLTTGASWGSSTGVHDPRSYTECILGIEQVSPALTCALWRMQLGWNETWGIFTLRVSPTGSSRAYIFWTLSEARSRLYRSQILQTNTCRKALGEICIFPLHHSRSQWSFKTLAPFLQKSTQFLLIFKGDGRFCNFFVKFSPIFFRN